jgi:hypothetical protein
VGENRRCNASQNFLLDFEERNLMILKGIEHLGDLSTDERIKALSGCLLDSSGSV